MSRGGSIAWMARHAVAANLVMLILFVGGAWSAFSIDKEVEPSFELDIVEVSVGYPGAAPSEVEEGIILPVEEAVSGIQGIREMTSRAWEGNGRVTIEFVAGSDRGQAFQDVDQAISRIQTFPADIRPPQVRLQSEQRRVMGLTLYGDVPIIELRGLAERLRDQLLSHESLTQVEIRRAPAYVTHVEIPLHLARAHGLTVGDIARVVGRSSRDVSAGVLETESGEILLRLNERKQWASEFSSIPVLTDDGGAAITLGDLADVRDGFEETGFPSHFNEKPAVEISIHRVGDQSPLEISDAVSGVVESFALPGGVALHVGNSSAHDYKDRLSLLVENGVLAIIIVFVVLALFLELRLAFWVMMGMAVSFFGGIMFLPVSGVSINMISMFGFLVVLGIVVDDAIVVGENVYEHRRRGADPMTAAIEGTREIASPVTLAILTSVMTFTPLLFMPGVTGKYWWPLPAVVITVLLVSLLEALYILPAHLGNISKRRFAIEKSWGRVQGAFARAFDRMVERYYGNVLNTCLRFRYVTLAASVSLLVVVAGYGYSGHMGMVLMPEVAADEIEAGIRLPVGTTPEQAAEIAHAVTRSTRAMFDEHDLYKVADGIKTNIRGGSFVDVEIVMKPPDQRDMTANQVIELWRDQIGDIPGVSQITFEAERSPGGHRQDISIDLSHNDIEVLAKVVEIFVARVGALEDVRDVSDNYDKGKDQFNVKMRAAGWSLGLSPDGVGEQLRDAFFGALALRQLRGTNEIEVRVKLPRSERDDLNHFDDFVIRTPSGAEVPLAEVASVERSKAFRSINRRNGRRIINVSFDAEPKSAITRVLRHIRDVELPSLRADFPGITWSFRGSQAEMRESTRALWAGFAAALFGVFAILAIGFRSYSQPFVVIGAIPFGIVGAVVGHILLDYNLSLVSVMGLVALSGVVVNDALIMVDYANRRRREVAAFPAILEAGIRRFRPIVLTTLTTFAGLTPIILETSQQARHLIPMAISLGFGILFATAIILLVVPCLYLVVDDVTSQTRLD